MSDVMICYTIAKERKTSVMKKRAWLVTVTEKKKKKNLTWCF